MKSSNGNDRSDQVKRKFGKKHLTISAIVLSLILAAGAVFVVLRPRPSPKPVAEKFATAWTDGNHSAFRDLISEPAALDETNPFELIDELQPSNVLVTASQVEEGEKDRAIAQIEVAIAFGDTEAWNWDTQVPMIRVKDVGWRMVWSPEAFHPKFASEHSLTKTTAWPERAPILAVGGQELASATEDILVGIQPSRLESRDDAKKVLAEQLDVAPESVDAALDAPGVQPDHFVAITQVRKRAFEEVREIVFPVPGLVFRETAGRGAPNPDFANHLLGSFGEITAERLEELGSPYQVGDPVGLSGLEATFETQLAGRPSITIEIVGQDEVVAEIVTVAEQVAPEPLQTTIDFDTQQAAEKALGSIESPGAFVAVDSATGEIRAVVSEPTEDGFNRAFSGAYPPGSTFKIVTTTAILSEGTTPETTVDCPATKDVEGKTFTNFEGSALGEVPFSQAFAESCNTAMIELAEGVSDSSFNAAAEAFGFGVDYTVGVPVVGASFPTPTSAADRAAASIGQSRITASPLHMATVASAAVEGIWRSPILIPGSHEEQVTRSLPTEAAAELPSLMREVVLNGSGTAANVDGIEVRGKSGTAEYGEGDPLPTHAWFVAEANGLGIAVIVEDGSSGGVVAAPLVTDFLNALPQNS